MRHYKHWLDEFAAWFKEQLRLEKESPEGHKIDPIGCTGTPDSTAVRKHYPAIEENEQ
ncbi:MAG: hypothetical protein OI860_00630 (plasmid) [Candidatus Methanoperedens sp.]|nr:MAG: hypothetical protein OI863_00685 [Candidatus Methanoperedens sp.]WAM22300.1 MAG: hypothetical protein OI860_00630 [Candidatus Methanoperedens sp.]